jgi:hypothetical protein
LPFAFATHVEHIERTQASLAQSPVQFLAGNLHRLQHRQASLLPRRHAARQITTQIFDADTSQPQPSFLNLRVAFADQNWLCVDTENPARPRRKLPRERDADRPRHVSRRKLVARTNIKHVGILLQQRLHFGWRKSR